MIIGLTGRFGAGCTTTYNLLIEEHNFVGFSLSDFLREIAKQASSADYIIMTCDDNYYTPNLVAELKAVIKDNPGMIYWDMIHSHAQYHYFNCYPSINHIDMGAFATRIDLAKQIHLNTTFAADGEIVEDFKKKFLHERIVKIDKVLFVHN